VGSCVSDHYLLEIGAASILLANRLFEFTRPSSLISMLAIVATTSYERPPRRCWDRRFMERGF